MSFGHFCIEQTGGGWDAERDGLGEIAIKYVQCFEEVELNAFGGVSSSVRISIMKSSN